jgi:hypothetical protein
VFGRVLLFVSGRIKARTPPRIDVNPNMKIGATGLALP